MVENLRDSHPPGTPVQLDDPKVKEIEKALGDLNGKLKSEAEQALAESEKQLETMKAQLASMQSEVKKKEDAFAAAQAAATAKAEKAQKLAAGVPVVVLLGDPKEHFALRFERQHTPADAMEDLVSRLLDIGAATLKQRQAPLRR
jgi:Tfp pilus assembly protein FimV